MNEYLVEVSRKVFNLEEGTSILVEPSEENPEDYTTIRTDHCEISKGWYGDIRLSLPNKMAKVLAEVILEHLRQIP